MEYAHDQSIQSYGMEAAEALGLDPSLVFKTLVVTATGGDSDYAVAVIPVNRQLDQKAMASVRLVRRNAYQW